MAEARILPRPIRFALELSKWLQENVALELENDSRRMHEGAQVLETEYNAAILPHPEFDPTSQNHTVNSSSECFPQLVTLVHATARSKGALLWKCWCEPLALFLRAHGKN